MPDHDSTSAGSIALFARGSSETVELRGQCPRFIVDAIDAQCAILSKKDGIKRDRMQIVNKILGDWAKEEYHDATLFLRIVDRNPDEVETAGDTP